MDASIIAALIGAAAGTANAVGGSYLQAGMNKRQMRYARELANRGLTNSDLQAFELNRQSAQEARDFALQMDSTNYQRKVADMQAAGVNPALAIGGVQGAPSSNATATAQNTGNVSPIGVSAPDISAVAELALRARQISNEYKLQNRALDLQERDIERKEGETSSVIALNLSKKDYQEIVNKYADESEELKIEGQKASNKLTDKKVEEADQAIAESKERVNKLIEETKNEVEKRDLIIAEKILKTVQAREIVELLPYKKALMSAQSDAAKASAALSMTEALFKQGLIDEGYIESVARKAAMDADIAFSDAELKAFTSDIKHGRLFKEDGSTFDKISGKFLNATLGGIVSAMTVVGDCLPTGLLVGLK